MLSSVQLNFLLSNRAELNFLLSNGATHMLSNKAEPNLFENIGALNNIHLQFCRTELDQNDKNSIHVRFAVEQSRIEFSAVEQSNILIHIISVTPNVQGSVRYIKVQEHENPKLYLEKDRICGSSHDYCCVCERRTTLQSTFGQLY